MPNWVNNKLTISGDPETIDQLLVKVSLPHFVKRTVIEDGKRVDRDIEIAPDFCLWNIVKPIDIDAYNTNDNWYNWNVSHWGTKWDVEGEVDRTDPTRVVISFDTAWGAPDPAIDVLASMYPSLVFSLEYEEEQGWGGEILWEEGEGNQIREWDVPEAYDSHADRVADAGTCPCEYGDIVYDDCPKESSSDEQVHSPA